MEAFNDKNCPKCVWQGTPFVTFSSKNGKITFNGVAVRMMNLTAGDQVEFYYVREENSWYVGTVQDGGFILHQHASSRALIFTRMEFVLAFYNTNLYEGTTVRCNLHRQRKVNGKMVYKLDLSNLLNK